MSTPKLTFALPVWNGERTIARAIDSVLAQTFSDFELVISDNCSTDTTPEICRRYAKDDSRVRFVQNKENIGLLPNFNHALSLGRGELFRWFSADDWFRPEYAKRCVELLDNTPDKIAVSSRQQLWHEGGTEPHAERELRVNPPRPDSESAVKRFDAMLDAFGLDLILFDPIYSTYRRQTLERSRGFQVEANSDFILAAELSLVGPYAHIDEVLCDREFPERDREFDRKLLRPPGKAQIDDSVRRYVRNLIKMVSESKISPTEKALCMPLIAREGIRLGWYFHVVETRSAIVTSLRDAGIPVPSIRRLFNAARKS